MACKELLVIPCPDHPGGFLAFKGQGEGRPLRKPHLASIGVERKEEYTSPRIRPTVGCPPSLGSRFKFNLEFAEPGFAVSFGYL